MKNYDCPLCVKSFWTWIALTTHKIIDHGPEVNSKDPKFVSYFRTYEGMRYN